MQDFFAHCEELVRTHDKDRFLASLFAPADRRKHLFALNAFALEIGRVKYLVHEPMAGIIRLQWWRDAVSGLRDGEAVANPVAAALLETIANTGVDRDLLTQSVEARQAELQGEPAINAEQAIFVAAAQILGERNAAVSAAAESAARAVTFVRDPADPAKARDAYSEFRSRIHDLPKAALPAFLTVALVPLLSRRPQASQWRKQLALLRAAWLGFPKY